MNTRYLMFMSDYEGDSFQGEADSLEAAAQQEYVDVVLVVEPDKPVYRLELRESDHTEPLEGQCTRTYWAWFNSSDEIVAADVFYKDSYR